MKTVLLVLLMLLSGPVLAQSGVFYNEERIGEGITAFDWTDLHGVDQLTFYFYSYDKHDRQRWLFASDPIVGGESTGNIYETEGTNYPRGVPTPEPFNPYIVTVGRPYAVGTYIMLKFGGGYVLWVDQLPDAHPSRDYLYGRTWYFTTPLIVVN